MKRSRLFHGIFFVSAAVLLIAFTAAAQSDTPPRKPDLADAAQGTYLGDVISDSEGSSRSNVTVTVKRIDTNLVRLTSDYARLPTIDVPLTQAMDKILNASGTTTFLLDRSKSPIHLDISFLNEVSWAGVKQ